MIRALGSIDTQIMSNYGLGGIKVCRATRISSRFRVCVKFNTSYPTTEIEVVLFLLPATLMVTGLKSLSIIFPEQEKISRTRKFKKEVPKSVWNASSFTLETILVPLGLQYIHAFDYFKFLRLMIYWLHERDVRKRNAKSPRWWHDRSGNKVCACTIFKKE